MKRYEKITALFVTGLLFIGVGSGIAFAEYSSFSYGGKKTIGNVQTQKTRIERERTPGIPFLVTGCENIQVVEDASLSADRLVFEVEYHPEYIQPHVETYREEEPEEEPEEELEEEPEEAFGDENEDEKAGEVETNEDEKGGDGFVPQIRREVFSIWGNENNDMAVMLEIKDEFLQAVKERKIYEYQTDDDIKGVTVYLSPEAKEEMKVGEQMGY